ncbi:hypothetical protein [uncultured Mobiluncus sp.]|uniref:hypothetical protein n=1 Tax=uncultured Mobiluncus sp. TaxID=293425 RepID=UPI002601EC99|nr:hypothetical protein [uncultured Mobiluncus sp.]
MSVTVWQLAQSTGLSTKWTSRCLSVLEGIGLITWQRGWIDNGKPCPGFITIIKARLLGLVHEAWSKGKDRWALQRAITARRLQDLKKLTLYPRRSKRVELSSHLDTLSVAATSGGDTKVTTPPPDWAIEKEYPVKEENNCPLCDHGYIKESNNCPHCHRIQEERNRETTRNKSWSKERRRAWRNARARRNKDELERLTAEEQRLTSEQWRREHPGVNGFDWLKQQLDGMREGARL